MESIGEKLEYISRKWWFYLLLLLIFFFVPPFTSRGIPAYEEFSPLFAKVLESSLKPYHFLAPLFHIAPVLLILSLLRFGDKVTRVFSSYVGINFLFIAFAQPTAFLEEYGFVVLTGGMITLIVPGVYWIWEALEKRGNMDPPSNIPCWKYWVVPFAVLAFWSPMHPSLELAPLLTSYYGLAFCITAPVFLAILSLYHPKVNIPAFRVTAFIGALLGAMNIILFFFGGDLWIFVILHLPLLLISTYCIALTLRKPEKKWSKEVYAHKRSRKRQSKERGGVLS